MSGLIVRLLADAVRDWDPFSAGQLWLTPLMTLDPAHPSEGENMPIKIFVNLPVKNLNRSVDFFTKLGFSFDQQYTDETATCMVVNEDIFVMLLTYDKFRTFTPNEICDATKSTEVLVCLSCESRDKVDEMVLALLFLTLHDDGRAWKGHDWMPWSGCTQRA